MSRIIGHEKIRSLLGAMLERGAVLPHAFLFYGPEGVGKRTIAVEFARGILCRRRQFGGCETCEICEEWKRLGTMRDFLEVLPNDKGIIPIEASRHISEFLSRTPGLAAGKVVVVDEADRMTEEAENSLLKTLEEPPADSTLILVSAKPGRLYPTIRSRLLPVRFSLVPDAAMADIPQHIRALAGGRPGKAYRLLADPGLQERLTALLQRATRVLSADAAEKLAFAGDLAQDAEMRDACLAYWLDVFHRMLHDVLDASRRRHIAQNARLALTASLLLADTEVQPRLLIEQMLLAFV